MATIRKLTRSLPETDQTAFSLAYPQIRLRILRVILIWLGVTSALAAVTALLMRNSRTIPVITAVSVILMVSIPVLWIILSATENACKRNLPQGQPPTMEQMQADQASDAEQTKLRRERLTMTVGCVFIFLLCPVFLLIAAIRAACTKHTPGTAACAANQYVENLVRKTHAVTIFFLPVLLMCTMFPISFQSRGRAEVTSMNQTARGILNAVWTYQTDLDEAGQKPEWRTVIAEAAAPASEFTVQYGVQQYCPELKKTNLWYAVVIDETGAITEVYCSRMPLTEDSLVPPDNEKQLKLASNPIHAREIIGYSQSKTSTS